MWSMLFAAAAGVVVGGLGGFWLGRLWEAELRDDPLVRSSTNPSGGE